MKHFPAFLMLLASVTIATAGEPVISDHNIRSPGKPLHPIQVKVVVAGNVKAGVPSEARVAISSSMEFESYEISVLPPPGMVVMEDRFQRGKADFTRGVVELPIRFSPGSDSAQPVEVHVRAVTKDGRAMSRTVTLSLDYVGETRQGKVPHNIRVPDTLPEPEGDAVTRARQDISRGN